VTDATPSAALPPLNPGEVYVYSHGNGAIFVKHAEGRSMLAPLPEVVALAERCRADGVAVVGAWDDTPVARAVIDRLRATGVELLPFAASQPPHFWGSGTTALMEAAANGSDRILDDLLARGVDLGATDDSGSTALHHAAANGNLHAIDALVAAGADVGRANAEGFTAHMLAVACRETAAANRLLELGATVTTGPDTRITFSLAHFATFAVWLIPLVFVVVLVVALWPLRPLVAAGIAAYVAMVAAVLPPRPFWSGGAPRAMEGTTLVLRGVTGRRRTIDLHDVTLLGMGGSTSRVAHGSARWLLLAHPDGAPATKRTLRKLLVADREVEALADRLQRVVVVVLAGFRTDEVIRPVSAVLRGLDVDVSASAAALAASARAAAQQPSPRRPSDS
jgi:hypothetical protein